MKKLLIMILLSPCLSYSATRNIVPRATSEGYIGLSTKTWAGVYADQFFGDGSSLTGLATDGELAAVAASTAPLKDYANWNTAYGWGDHAGLYLVAPASFTYQTPLVAGMDYLAPDGDGSGLSGVIQSTATGYYPLWVATATYALNGGGGGGVVDSTAVIDGLPIGSIIQYSTTTAPEGYLYCDGSYVSTTTYSDLFAVVGHRFSTFTVSGSPAVFQLPDFRGMFARGALGNLNSTDPDANRVVGSTQTDTMQGHGHNLTGGTSAGSNTSSVAPGNGAHQNLTAINQPSVFDTFGVPRWGTETRPENIAVAFMIKYGHVGTVAISSSSLLVGGDNTFTGANTFTGSVTVSSFTATGDTLFSGATSTATFSGWVDIGMYLHKYTTDTGYARGACSAGYRAIHGGIYTPAGSQTRLSYPSIETSEGTSMGSVGDEGSSNFNSWSISSDSANFSIAIICVRIK